MLASTTGCTSVMSISRAPALQSFMIINDHATSIQYDHNADRRPRPLASTQSSHPDHKQYTSRTANNVTSILLWVERISVVHSSAVMTRMPAEKRRISADSPVADIVAVMSFWIGAEGGMV